MVAYVPMRKKVNAYVAEAVVIARRDLIALFTDDGIIAGGHHFVDLWARDCLFATFGATVSGNGDWSRKTIETFLGFQRTNGQIPFLIRRSKLTLGKYFGSQTYLPKPQPQFRSSQSAGLVPDGGLLTVISSSVYAHHTRDRAFVRRNYPNLERALVFYVNRFGDSLIREWFQCEWADAVMKRGMTLYTNVLYVYALRQMAAISSMLGKKGEEKRWLSHAELVGGELRRLLWTGSYFADWRSVVRHDYFGSHGNMLAVAAGITTPGESRLILDTAASVCWNDFTLETNFPKYPAWRIPIQNYLTGTWDYHNRGCLWLQPGLWYAIALARTGRRKESSYVFRCLARKITEYDGVYEVYEKSGVPVRRLLYTSEHPFAWSAGLFLYASHILRGVS